MSKKTEVATGQERRNPRSTVGASEDPASKKKQKPYVLIAMALLVFAFQSHLLVPSGYASTQAAGIRHEKPAAAKATLELSVISSMKLRIMADSSLLRRKWLLCRTLMHPMHGKPTVMNSW